MTNYPNQQQTAQDCFHFNVNSEYKEKTRRSRNTSAIVWHQAKPGLAAKYANLFYHAIESPNGNDNLAQHKIIKSFTIN
jgi:hypothetical protein